MYLDLAVRLLVQQLFQKTGPTSDLLESAGLERQRRIHDTCRSTYAKDKRRRSWQPSFSSLEQCRRDATADIRKQLWILCESV